MFYIIMTSISFVNFGSFGFTSVSVTLPRSSTNFIHRLIRFEDLRTPSGRYLSLRDFCTNYLVNELELLESSYEVIDDGC